MKKSAIYILLIIGGLVFAYPFLWMLSATFKPEVEIGSIGLWSSNFSMRSYIAVFQKIPIGKALLNSLLVSGCVTFSVILFGSIVGYALSRLRFFGRDFLLGLILFTMVIPFQITLIPMYILMVKFGWVDSLSGFDRTGNDQCIRHFIIQAIFHGHSAGFDRCGKNRWL